MYVSLGANYTRYGPLNVYYISFVEGRFIQEKNQQN